MAGATSPLRATCYTGKKENRDSLMSGNLYVRVDNRLLHGQVVQFWLGHLQISHLIVADDDVATNEAMKTIYSLAMPEAVGLTITPMANLKEELKQVLSVNTMVLLKDIKDAEQASSLGVVFNQLTLGNIHSSADRTRITDSVYLSDSEIERLVALSRKSIRIEIQTFPGVTLRLDPDGEGGARWVKS